jgi:phosphatidylglycerophosphate synthase
MVQRPGRVLTVQFVTIARFLLGVTFAVIAFQAPIYILAIIYGLAVISDLVDGALARKLSAETEFGSTLDLISDKSLTIISVLYAVARGMSLAPLAIIATRDILLLGLRIAKPTAGPLLSTSRIFGGIAAGTLWVVTFILILARSADTLRELNVAYWVICVVLTTNLIFRLHRARVALTRELRGG